MAKKTILIADNSVINRTLLAGILQDEYAILQAADGAEAIELLIEHADEISVALLDLFMPIKDGFQVMVEKTYNSRIAGIPVIALSASGEASTELRALNAGAIDFLPKPVEPEIARRRVKLAIDQRELEALHIQNRIYEERQYVMDHDALTGVFSKAAFYREVRQMLDDAPEKDFVLIRWDIEKFKLINSLFGIEMGDTVLKTAAEILGRHMEHKGIFGRYESDNFVACFRAGTFDVEKLMSDICEELRGSFDDAGITQSLVLSTGVYPIDDANITIEEMCDRAGLAQRSVKGDYERHLMYYDDRLRRQLLEEQDILDNMERALADGEFEVYLQPVYSMATEQVASAEALVRWNRAGKGIVSPGVFIPLFERNGFISALDRYIWEQVCQIQVKRRSEGLDPLPISVNLSRKSLYNPNIFEEIEELTQHYEVEPSLFRLEVTESAYMDNAAQLISTTEKLQEHGFLVLMDDFGSGYSSLNTLKEIPVNMLKLDLKFMEGFDEGGRVGTIMASVLRMAKWLGVPVIAEGVETFEQYAFLRSIGCEYTQGFYFAKPMPYDQFEEFLNTPHSTSEPDRTEFLPDLINDIMGGDRVLPYVLSGLFDGTAVYEYENENVEVLRADAGYFDMFGYNAQELESAGNRLNDILAQGDYQTILDTCETAVKTRHAARACINAPDGRRLNLSFMDYMLEENGRNLIVAGFAYVDNQ